MKTHKQLIAGIVFLVLQIVVFAVNGMPTMGGGAYGVGYLIGSMIPGVLGALMVATYFIKKNKR